MLEWTPYSYTRRKGKPKARWDDEIINYSGIAWVRDVGFDSWNKAGETLPK